MVCSVRLPACLPHHWQALILSDGSTPWLSLPSLKLHKLCEPMRLQSGSVVQLRHAIRQHIRQHSASQTTSSYGNGQRRELPGCCLKWLGCGSPAHLTQVPCRASGTRMEHFKAQWKRRSRPWSSPVSRSGVWGKPRYSLNSPAFYRFEIENFSSSGTCAALLI